jgi:hypothetical protein
MLKQACPEEMPKQVRHDIFRVQHDFSGFGFDLTFEL